MSRFPRLEWVSMQRLKAVLSVDGPASDSILLGVLHEEVVGPLLAHLAWALWYTTCSFNF